VEMLRRMDTARWAWPVAIIVSTVMLDALVVGNIDTPLRPLVAIWFVSVCPGLALVRLLRLRDGWSEMAVSLALSLTLGVIVATALVYADWWSPKLGLAILSAVSLAGAGFQLRAAFSDHSPQIALEQIAPESSAT
jgi:uncharacterized membrane protein